ncbi:MAG: hypothetical protein CMM38_05995 [Rhodospirillaceae bacterium]|nr:hypothetical protein [Rhodospirillaceae bacterium]|tara:strand:- start:9 stop:794 length:786 start_codon:yes stop_codon:yes gene_type:complete
MVNIVPITKSEFLDRKWLASDNYEFAAKYATATLAVGELSQAMRSLPIGFVKYDGYYTLVSILGLKQGENLFVNKEGNWITAYKPAVLRSYPFSLLSGEKDQMLLAFDEDSLSKSNATPNNSFYGETGEITDELSTIMSFLTEVHDSYNKTVQLCEMINNFGLLDKWNISIRRGEKEINIEGIYKVNEEKLQSLDASKLKDLQRVSALGLIYGHIFSGANLGLLERLANFRDSAYISEKDNIESVEQMFMDADDSLDFSKL